MTSAAVTIAEMLMRWSYDTICVRIRPLPHKKIILPIFLFHKKHRTIPVFSKNCPLEGEEYPRKLTCPIDSGKISLFEIKYYHYTSRLPDVFKQFKRFRVLEF